MKSRVIVACLGLVPAIAWAQAPPPPLVSPHAVAVVDQSPVGESPAADHGSAKAAGMPLRDGALAPGTLTVRVVRGSFDDNLVGQAVTVTVSGGRTEQATTDAQGRATFAHLSVGASVSAAATVGGAALASDAFVMPAESGVRLLLVVGDGPVVGSGAPAASADSRPAEGDASSPTLSATSTTAVDTPWPRSARDDTSSGVTAIRVVMATATLLAFVLVGFKRPSGR
jgi:hypothetical protein